MVAVKIFAWFDFERKSSFCKRLSYRLMFWFISIFMKSPPHLLSGSEIDLPKPNDHGITQLRF